MFVGYIQDFKVIDGQQILPASENKSQEIPIPAVQQVQTAPEQPENIHMPVNPPTNIKTPKASSPFDGIFPGFNRQKQLVKPVPQNNNNKFRNIF